MKAKKIVRYRIPVSVNFPQTHARKGEQTYFVEKIRLALMQSKYPNIQVSAESANNLKLWPKLHTCRVKLQSWGKKIEKIAKGEAVLELYYWTGKPYNSKTVTICQLGKDDGIGLQKISFKDGFIETPVINDYPQNAFSIALNDGLLWADFRDWFKNYDLSKEMAIIHFTPFRY